MGTWGYRSFENDSSLDWVASLGSGGLKAVEGAFDSVLESADAPEAPACDEAVAAAESLAALLGTAAANVPDDVTAWASREKRRPSGPLIAKARASIDRILADSELKDLWMESGDIEKWRSEILGLLQRLPATESLPPAQARPKPWWKLW